MGSEVTVIEFMDNICAGADKEVATKFKAILEKQKMKFVMKTKVTKITETANGVLQVEIESVATSEKSIVCFFLFIIFN